MRNLVRLTRLAAIASLFLIASPVPRLFAQEEGEAAASTGDEVNPTGVTGVFNGNSTTADSTSSFDPWTRNFRRGPIYDIPPIPGVVSAYGLSFSRTYNSKDLDNWAREATPSGALGNSMGQCWRHSYSASTGNWNNNGQTQQDRKESSGSVFPDGRVIPLAPGFGIECPPYYAPPIEEGFDQGMDTWVMADGGKIHFGHFWQFIGSYGAAQATSVDTITDPYGQVITIQHDTSCGQRCDAQNRILKVTDVGSGKYLEFTYYPDSDPLMQGAPIELGLIQRVEAHDQNGALLMWVEYHYDRRPNPHEREVNDRFLTRVDYSDGTYAAYEWDFGEGDPAFIKKADDPHYAEGECVTLSTAPVTALQGNGMEPAMTRSSRV